MPPISTVCVLLGCPPLSHSSFRTTSARSPSVTRRAPSTPVRLRVIMSKRNPAQDAERKEQVATMFAEYKAKAFSNTSEVTAQELKAMLDAKKAVVVIDVRTDAETKVSMIPGALTKTSFEQDEDKYKNHIVVAYCTIGYRSGQYVDKLKAKKFNALNLKGSILSWTLEGYPLVTPTMSEGVPSSGNGDETKRVHVFGEAWNLVGAEYEAIWHTQPVLLIIDSFVTVVYDSFKGFLAKFVPRTLWPTWLLGKRPRKEDKVAEKTS